MIKINDTIIQANTQDILNILKSELAIKGIERFNVFRNNGDNIQTNCPFHKGGQERKPSFGINGEINKCHCFTCGWSGGIEEMISELFGYIDDGKYGQSWLIKRFNSISIEQRPEIKIPLRNTIQTKSTYITEEELDKYRYIHPYMYKRGLTDEIIERFDIGYDRERKCITFPIKDLGGNIIFVATRSISTKFFELPKGINKPVYCAELFTSGNYKKAYICESFLNCLTLWKYNIPAMAMIGTGNKYQYDILKELPVREYVLAFDPDVAGQKATQRFRKYVNNKIIKELDYTDTTKDINDLQEDVLTLKEIF